MIRRWAILPYFALSCLGIAYPATARILAVGPNAPFAAPSDAAREAKDGDTVQIAAGTYYDCAVWHASNLTIEGAGDATVITDNACEGKAAFVISGNDVVVRRLVLTRIRVADGNGAGIRGQGRNLTVEDVGFINDQYGLLMGKTGGALRIIRCRFADNGSSLDGRPTHGISAAGLDLLKIEDSVFSGARAGDHVIAQAAGIEIAGSRFTDEGGKMTGPLALLSGDTIVLARNTIDLAPSAADRPGAVLAIGNTSRIELRSNTLIEPGHTVPLLRNWTGTSAIEQDNTVPAGVAAVSERGRMWHIVRTWLGRTRDWAVQAKAVLRHDAGAVVHRL